MHKIPKLFPFLLLIPAIASAHDGCGASAAERRATIAHVNQVYVQSFLHSDAAGYRRLLADDFIAILSSGRVLDKATFVAAASQPAGMQNFRAEQVSIRLIGDVALVSAVTPYVTTDGKRGSNRYTDVWACRDRRWRTVSAEVTAVSEAIE